MTDQTSETTPDGLDVAAVRERVRAIPKRLGSCCFNEGTCDCPERPYYGDADEIEALLAALDEARGEVERLHSWAGLMELLDEHWPARAFPALPDDPDRDAGPRIVSLIRNLDAAESARDAAEGVVREVRALRGAEPSYFHEHEPVVSILTIRAVLDRLAPVTTDATEGQWGLLATDGRICFSSKEIAQSVAAGDQGYTVGAKRVPVVAALRRATEAAEWVLLAPATEAGEADE